MATEDKKYMEATRQPVLYYAGIMNGLGWSEKAAGVFWWSKKAVGGLN